MPFFFFDFFDFVVMIAGIGLMTEAGIGFLSFFFVGTKNIKRLVHFSYGVSIKAFQRGTNDGQ